MSADIEIIRAFYAALNRNDLEGVVADLDPDILRVEFEGLPMAGTFRGIDAVREHVKKGRGTWAEGSCEIEKILVSGEKLVVLVHVRVRLKGATEWLEGRIGDGFVLRAGKIVEFRTFAKQAEALAWAGLDAQGES